MHLTIWWRSQRSSKFCKGDFCGLPNSRTTRKFCILFFSASVSIIYCISHERKPMRDSWGWLAKSFECALAREIWNKIDPFLANSSSVEAWLCMVWYSRDDRATLSQESELLWKFDSSHGASLNPLLDGVKLWRYAQLALDVSRVNVSVIHLPTYT